MYNLTDITGPSCVNAASPLPVNAVGTPGSTNAFEEHSFELFSGYINVFFLPHVPIVTPINDYGSFGNAYDDETVEEEADINNVVSSYTILDAPLTKFLKDHPKDQGHTQEEGIDYDEVFAPVARIEAIMLFLAYASIKDFIVYQMDVKSAFLYEKIEEEVYVCQPSGFEDLDFPDKVYKVEKALYGLHQAPRACLDRKSTTGGCQFLGKRLILWQCKKQTIVVNSTTKTEYVAAASCCGQENKIERGATTASNLEAEQDSAKVKKVNGQEQIQALIDKQKVIIMEESIRRDLKFDDAEGTACLPNDTIFAELARMGAKTTAWNEFSSTMASVIICLANNQKFNFSKYIFYNIVKHLEGGVKFLMFPRFLQVFLNKQVEGMAKHKEIYVISSHTKKIFANMRRQGHGFFGNVTSLFETMMVNDQEEKKIKPKRNQRQVAEVHLPSSEILVEESIPTPSNDPLPSAKIAQAKEIAKLKKRVKKLEKRRKSRPVGLRRLKKAGSSKQVESPKEKDSLGAQEDASKEGRSIEYINQDAEITLVDESRGGCMMQICLELMTLKVMRFTAASVEDSAPTTATTVDVVDKLTLEKTLIAIKAAKPRVILTATTTVTTAITTSRAKSIVFYKQVQAHKPSISSSKDKCKVKMIEPEKPLKKKDQIALDEEVARKLEAEMRAEMEEEERIAREKDKANRAVIEEWDDVQATIDVDRQRKYCAAKRAKEIRNKPPIKAQQKSLKCTYMRNMEGFKQKDFKGKSFDDIKKMLDKVYKRVNTFVDMDTENVEESLKKNQAEVTEGSSKRAGQEIEKESAKKKKLAKQEQAKVADDDTAELKRCLEIVPKDDDDVAIKATPLSSKSPTIVDYKIYIERKKSYFKIIRAYGNLKNYLTFGTMFKNFKREDLEVLRSIVKERFKKSKPVDDMENLLFQTLKIMFEPHVEDIIWKYQQGAVKLVLLVYKVAVVFNKVNVAKSRVTTTVRVSTTGWIKWLEDQDMQVNEIYSERITMAGVDINTLTMEQYLALEYTLSGNNNEDAHDHVDRVLNIVDRLTLGAVNTWDLLKKAFIQRYYPPSKTDKRLKGIHNFKQESDESLYQAWERMTPTQALTEIQTIADHSQKWHAGTSSRNISNNSNTDGLDAIVCKLDNLGRDMKKLKKMFMRSKLDVKSVKDLTLTKNVLSTRTSNRSAKIKEWIKNLQEIIEINNRNQSTSLKNIENEIEQLIKELYYRTTNGAPSSSIEQCKVVNFDHETPYRPISSSVSVNVMPRNIFEYLRLASLRNTNMLVEIANMMKKAPLDVHKDSTYWWHDHGFEEEERDEMGIEIEKYDPPDVQVETFEVKKYSFKSGQSFVCVTKLVDDALPLGRKNGSRPPSGLKGLLHMLNATMIPTKIFALKDLDYEWTVADYGYLRLYKGFGSIAGGLDHVNHVIRLPTKHGIRKDTRVNRAQLLDFRVLTDEMDQAVTNRLRMYYTRDDGQTGSSKEIATKDGLRDYWTGISSVGDFLTGVPSYIAIKYPLRRLCHLLIAFSIFKRGQAPEKGSRMSGGHFIGRLAKHFRLFIEERLRGLTVVGDAFTWLVPRPKRQHDVVAEAAQVDLDVVEEGALAVPTPVQPPPRP
nr:copia protein [Tanacetum cinerariifolium]